MCIKWVRLLYFLSPSPPGSKVDLYATKLYPPLTWKASGGNSNDSGGNIMKKICMQKRTQFNSCMHKKGENQTTFLALTEKGEATDTPDPCFHSLCGN